MDRRLISAVASVGALGLIALASGTAIAADLTKSKRDIVSHGPFCAVFEAAVTERGKSRVATRRGTGEERGPPRMALVLGVAF